MAMRLTAGPRPARGTLLRQAHGDYPGGEAVHVLSIDGGGVRGLVPAMVLAEIEARCERPISELFHVVAGTSTGAVLALGLSVPAPGTLAPKWHASDGVGIYMDRLPEVFRRDRWQAVAGVGSLLHEKYDEAPLEAMLEHYFGNCRLSEALTNVVVPAYDLVTGDVLLFDTELAKTDKVLDVPMRLVVRGATAAPTYFEPERLGPPTVMEEHLVVDGGIFANNPAVCAFMQAQHRFARRDLVMVSLGTGGAMRTLRLEEVKSWGLAHWARPLLNLVLASASQATDHHLRSLLGESRYFRLQPDLDVHGCTHRLDDASDQNLAALQRAGEALIAAHSGVIDEICALVAR